MNPDSDDPGSDDPGSDEPGSSGLGSNEHDADGRKMTEAQLQYTADIQDALTKRNSRIAVLEAEILKLEQGALGAARREAWAAGQQHEMEYLARTGQFCPCGESCNPFSDDE